MKNLFIAISFAFVAQAAFAGSNPLVITGKQAERIARTMESRAFINNNSGPGFETMGFIKCSEFRESGMGSSTTVICEITKDSPTVDDGTLVIEPEYPSISPRTY